MHVGVCEWVWVCMPQCTCGGLNVCLWFFLSTVDSGYQLSISSFHLEENGSALVAACDYRFVPLPSSHVTCSLKA